MSEAEWDGLDADGQALYKAEATAWLTANGLVPKTPSTNEASVSDALILSLAKLLAKNYNEGWDDGYAAGEGWDDGYAAGDEDVDD